MDYRDLLKRYITHVDLNEGTAFLGLDIYRKEGGNQFTDEEWKELKKLSEEE